MPRLSICIATYNRAAFIGETLDTLLPQLGEDVELLVVDGASTDDTEQVVAARLRGYHGGRYLRLAKKGGVDQDYCRAVEAATGEYVWLFTDDDLVFPGAVAAVLRALAPGVELVILNAQVRDASLGRLIMPRRSLIECDISYAATDMDRLFLEQAGHLTYIGAVVMRRSTWLARPPEPYFGSEFVHVGVIFSAALPGDAVALADPVIVIRHGNAQWQPRAFEIWMEKWPRLAASLGGVSLAVRSRAAPAEPWRRLSALTYARALGSFGWPQLRRLAATHDTSAAWRLGAALVAGSPREVVRRAVAWYFAHAGSLGDLERYELEGAARGRRT